jgi:hypothetical protein
MRALVLFLAIVFCVASLSEAALAQGAATGGTRDTAGPTMVFPIRPRNGPAPSTAVPTLQPLYPYPPVVRLRRAYPVYIRR